jgi:hypothetical protein
VNASGDRQSYRISTNLAEEIVAASAASPSAKVIIVGSGQLDLLIALLRRGFANVDCLSPDGGPHPPKGETDLVIAAVRTDVELQHVLRRFGGVLHSGGRLLMHVAALDFRNERRVRELLLHAGFAALERLPSRGGQGHLWCARRQGIAMARAA